MIYIPFLGRFRNIPIRQKLIVIITITTAAALLLSGIGIVIADSFLFRGYLRRDLKTFARIIADNSTASLAFDDPRTATETLGALRARSHIVIACLYRADGRVLANYTRPLSGGVCPPMPNSFQTLSEFNSLTVSQPIILDERRIGSLLIQYDLGEMSERIQIYGMTVLIVLLVSSLIAFRLSYRLRDTFASPILELAKTTMLVTEQKDYSLRAQKLSNDEVGNLVGGFNEMLAGIQYRDDELRKSLGARDEALKKLAQLNRELRLSNEDLERSNADLERFAFVASHDLQEPLRMITIYSQLLERRYADTTGEARAYIAHIVGGAQRMRDLLLDLLGYMEIAAPPDTPPQPVDLNILMETVQQNLKASIEESGTIITWSKLPTVHANEGHLSSLFQNLISNSIKYRSEQPPVIHVTAEVQGDQYRFGVADNGMGIQPEFHSRIFVAFKRLHGKDIAGTGVGLAICQRIVERYGGRIWVQSELGKGATFLFTFPKMPAGG